MKNSHFWNIVFCITITLFVSITLSILINPGWSFLIGILTAGAYILNQWTEIPFNSVGVVSYFGKRTDQEISEGSYFPLPAFIEDVTIVSLQDMKIQIGEKTPFEFPSLGTPSPPSGIPDQNNESVANMITMIAKITLIIRPNPGHISITLNQKWELVERVLVDSLLVSMRALGSSRYYLDLTNNTAETVIWFRSHVTTGSNENPNLPNEQIGAILNNYGYAMVSVTLTKIDVSDATLRRQLEDTARESAQSLANKKEVESIIASKKALEEQGGIEPILAAEIAGAVARIPGFRVLRTGNNTQIQVKESE